MIDDLVAVWCWEAGADAVRWRGLARGETILGKLTPGLRIVPVERERYALARRAADLADGGPARRPFPPQGHEVTE